MTYSSPGSSGYPPAPGPGSYGTPAQYGPPAEPGPSKLPLYLTVAVVVLGFIAFLVSFGPMFTISEDSGPFGSLGLSDISFGGSKLPIIATLGAALLAGVGLLPKANNYHAIVAVFSTLATLLAISDLVAKPSGLSVGWAFWVLLAVLLIQAVVAIAALLLDAGVISAPTPRPKYEQQQFGQYGAPGGYYGQQPAQQAPQRPGYPSQYGGGYPPQGPSTGGFGAQVQPGAQPGPPTPPTGYPSFNPPPAVGPGQAPGAPVSPSAPTQQASTPPPSNGPASS